MYVVHVRRIPIRSTCTTYMCDSVNIHRTCTAYTPYMYDSVNTAFSHAADKCTVSLVMTLAYIIVSAHADVSIRPQQRCRLGLERHILRPFAYLGYTDMTVSEPVHMCYAVDRNSVVRPLLPVTVCSVGLE